MTFLRRLIVVLLATILMSSAALKLASGHDPRLLLGPASFQVVIALEIVLVGGLIARRWRRLAALTCMTIAAAGLLATLQFERPCGCLGTWAILSKRGHAILSAGLGLIASLVWTLEPRDHTIDRPSGAGTPSASS